ncbi:MAG: glycerophosphodiester phosphodiesterase [Anaerolineaceae bacterium]|nr:glycerophosphodiester phosphodiesterase [Anaerolineaceae bacterium]
MNLLAVLPKPIIFAHRGASAYAPENTLAAFHKAVELGADAVELDVKLSRDNEVVVFHDTTLQRITGVKEKVNQRTLVELKRLDAGSFFSPACQGEQIPMLAEVFAEVGEKIYINVELTNYSSPRDDLIRKTAEIVQSYRMKERVLFSSFDPRNLIKIRRYLPGATVGILALPGYAGLLNRSWLGKWAGWDNVHPFFNDTSHSYIKRQQCAGRRVHVWTVNDREVMRKLFIAGIDGIFTDDPVLARETLAAI